MEPFSKPAPAKEYHARRFLYGVVVDVCGNGYAYPLPNNADIDWGHGTRYSYNLAKVILNDFTGQAITDDYARKFDEDFISCMPMQGFTLPGRAIEEWLEEKGV